MTATLKKKTVKVLRADLADKYPTFDAEFAKLWRKIVRKALSEQIRKNPQSKALRGIKEIVRNYFTILLDDDELNKVVDMISGRFCNSKFSCDWDMFREHLPNIFPEKSIGQLIFTEDDDGVPDTVSMNEEPKHTATEGCAVIIIQDGKFKSEYTDVPSEVALTINMEISKALS